MTTRPKTGGRQAGTPNRRTVASRRWVQEQADPLAFLVKVMEGEDIDGQTPTLAERLNAASQLRRVIVPDAKDSPISIALPPVTSPADFTGAMNAVLSAVSAGDLTPGEGKAVADLLDGARKAYETADLAERIAKLEGRAP